MYREHEYFTIEKHVEGYILRYRRYNDVVAKRFYIGYSRKESIKSFRELTNTVGAHIEIIEY